MNRTQRRQQEKSMRKKLTNEQYKDYSERATAEMIAEKVEESREKHVRMVTEALVGAISDKKFRISEKRQTEIMKQFGIILGELIAAEKQSN